MMPRLFSVLLLALALATPLGVGRTAAQDDAFLTVAEAPGIGAYLADAAGMTLYLFTPDTAPNESTCSGGCAEAWPPLAPADAMALPVGVPGELTTFDREDGTQQVAYNGIPLYYFADDAAPGDVNGQGAGGVWFVVPPGATHGPYAEAPGEGTPTPMASVGIGFTEELGPFLADSEGMTLYLFTEDTTVGESACYDGCAEAWPPVPAGDMLTLPPGIPGTLGAIERTDGMTQLTYNDIPLYYYAEDTAPGDTTGQDVGEVWYIVPPGMEFGDEPHHGAEEMEGATPTSG
jgi:predicted lipoprotein with Yx(FWY)xxD motif